MQDADDRVRKKTGSIPAHGVTPAEKTRANPPRYRLRVPAGATRVSWEFRDYVGFCQTTSG